MALSNPELIKICRGLALLLDSGIGGAECAFLLARECSSGHSCRSG